VSEAKAKRRPSRFPLVLRGEASIATMGIAVAAILLAVTIAVAWWSYRTQRETLHAARTTQIRALGDVLSQSAESMLAGDDLTALRRMVIDARRNYDLIDCRVMLPDGKVIASADPTRITLVSLPERWATGPVDDPENAPDAGKMAMIFPLRVLGRGAAALAIEADVQYPVATLLDMQSGIALFSVLGMLALLMVYRATRQRVMSLGVIREALHAVADGESSLDAVTLSANHGRDAEAWNTLVTANMALKQKAVAERVQSSLGTRRESSGALDMACDALPQGLMMIDEQGRVSYANGAAAVMLQRKREEMAGAEAATLFSSDPVRAAVTAAVKGTSRIRQTIEVDRKGEDGDRMLRFNIRPLRRDGAQDVMVTIDDVTQQRVAEASRNAFVAQVAHELRTPLTNIRLYVETALDEGQNDAAIRGKSLNVINQETRRLEVLVGEMLSIAEIEAGSLKIHRDDVRLDSLFTELENDYKAQAVDKNIQLKFSMPPKLPVIQADRDKFVLSLHNLIGNALKYTPKGGTVTVAVRHENNKLSVDVTDTGIGVDEAELELIFDRFYRAKDPRVAKIPGTGLGLALAREVVRQHGGELTATSQINHGSTFTLTLPVPAVAG